MHETCFKCSFADKTCFELRKQSIECVKIEVAVPTDKHDVFITMAKDVAVSINVEELMIQHPDGTIMFLKGAN